MVVAKTVGEAVEVEDAGGLTVNPKACGEYTGVDGATPPLQLGGVHDAVMDPPPAAGKLTEPTLPNKLLEDADVVTDGG